MSMIQDARTYLDVPPVPIAPGGIQAVARVIDVSNPHDLMGTHYETDACASVERWEQWCIPVPDCATPPAPENVKNFVSDPMELIVGDPFALYDGVACPLAQAQWNMERASRRFDYGERAGIDLAITDRLAADAIGDPIDLGGPFPLPEAIGAAEALASHLYGGVPTLLIPTLVVACGCNSSLISRGFDGSLVSCHGSLVASVITSQQVGAPPHPPTVTMYVTGMITLLRGPKMEFTAPGSSFDCDGNSVPPRALVERLYVPLIECLVGKVEVSCS